MSEYRVAKIRNGQMRAFEHKYFQYEAEAEKYAQETSKSDEAHIYKLECKTDDDEYLGTKIFQNGVVTGSIY